MATDMSGDDDMEISVDVLGISPQECAKEVMSVVIDKAYSEITRVKPKNKVLFSISNEEVEISPYVAHLIGEQELVYLVELGEKDAEIDKLKKMLLKMKDDHEKAIEAVHSACDDRVFKIGEVGRAQIDVMAESYVAAQPSIISEVVTLLTSASAVTVSQRAEDVSNIKKLAIENLDKAMTRDISK